MDLQTILENTINFISDSVLPLLVGIALVVFIFNFVRYSFIEGLTEDGRTKAKSLAIWGIAGFVVISSIWGIISLIRGDFGIRDGRAIIPDYMCSKDDRAKGNCRLDEFDNEGIENLGDFNEPPNIDYFRGAS